MASRPAAWLTGWGSAAGTHHGQPAANSVACGRAGSCGPGRVRLLSRGSNSLGCMVIWCAAEHQSSSLQDARPALCNVSSQATCCRRQVTRLRSQEAGLCCAAPACDSLLSTFRCGQLLPQLQPVPGQRWDPSSCGATCARRGASSTPGTACRCFITRNHEPRSGEPVCFCSALSSVHLVSPLLLIALPMASRVALDIQREVAIPSIVTKASPSAPSCQFQFAHPGGCRSM